MAASVSHISHSRHEHYRLRTFLLFSSSSHLTGTFRQVARSLRNFFFLSYFFFLNICSSPAGHGVKSASPASVNEPFFSRLEVMEEAGGRTMTIRNHPADKALLDSWGGSSRAEVQRVKSWLPDISKRAGDVQRKPVCMCVIFLWGTALLPKPHGFSPEMQGGSRPRPPPSNFCPNDRIHISRRGNVSNFSLYLKKKKTGHVILWRCAAQRLSLICNSVRQDRPPPPRDFHLRGFHKRYL